MSIQIERYHTVEAKQADLRARLAARVNGLTEQLSLSRMWGKISGRQTEAACLARIATVYLPGTQPPQSSARSRFWQKVSLASGQFDPHTIYGVAIMSAIWIGFFIAFWPLL